MQEDEGVSGKAPEAAPSDVAIDMVLQEVPRGALFVSALAVALLMLGWFILYLGVFLPRGSVG